MRLFFAVPISTAIKANVRSAIAAFPVRNPPWRWIPPDNMHLTLKFLGEVDERLLAELREIGGRAAAASRPFRIAYGAFGAFPNLSRPRVIFFEAAEGTQELARVAGLLEEGAESVGIPREGRPFTAHLTLARIKSPLPPGIRDALGKVPTLPASSAQEVDRFSLMLSHLAPQGATYEELASFPLSGAPR